MRRLSLATAAALLLGGGALAVTAPAHAAGMTGLIATYSTTQNWGSGFAGQFTIVNDTNATVNSWTMTFDMPAGEAITSLWNASYTSSGSHYTVTSPSWASPLAPGASADAVGFDAGASGTVTAPANCLMNGAPCAGQPADTSPPSTPASLHVTGTGPGSVALAWNASTDNVGVTGYRVYEGSSVTASATGTSVNVGGLLAGAATRSR